MTLKNTARALVCALPFATGLTPSANADTMLDANIGDIIIVGFSFCPDGWMPANGQVLNIADYETFYSVIGTTYGGDGQTTFALPDFRGRAIIHQGQGEGLTNIPLGERSGPYRKNLFVTNLPPHTHTAYGSSSSNDQADPGQASFADYSNAPLSGYNQPANTPMDSDVVTNSGQGEPVWAINPSLGLTVCIAPSGIYPQRN